MNSIAAPVPLTLACHPQTPCQAIRGVEAVLRAGPGNILGLTFVLECDLSRLRIPEFRSSRSSRSSQRADNLWQHTCFEVFVMAEDGPGYREFNFSPSGEWAVYTFRSYREGEGLDVELDVDLAPGIVVRRTLNRLELDAEIGQNFLPPGRSLRLGLSAVMEDVDGELSYWALRHPEGKPDFHHTDAFASQLVLP